MKSKRQKLIDKLDKLWSLKVRKVCECSLCGRQGDIGSFDAHHIRRRGNMATRWDLENGVCLCKGCHRFKVHLDTLIANQMIENLKKERGEKWYKDLVKRSREIAKFSIKDLEKLIEKIK